MGIKGVFSLGVERSEQSHSILVAVWLVSEEQIHHQNGKYTTEIRNHPSPKKN
jgi:hypothetical protein